MMRISLVAFLSFISLSTTGMQVVTGFVYHRFGDDRYPSTNIRLDQFEVHLKHLAANNYKTLTLSEALTLLEAKQPSNEKYVVLTIDDAYKSFYEHALPLLVKYGMRATLFVNTETVGYPDFMDWDEIQNAQDAGIQIGNHSHSHAYFLNTSFQDFQDDLFQSDNLFKAHLANAPSVYAYPYGEWNEAMAAFLKEQGYEGAAAQHSGVMHANSNRFALPRFPMSMTYADLPQFKEKLQMKGFSDASSTFFTEGSKSTPYPHLRLTLNAARYDKRNVQGFISGKEALLKYEETGNAQLEVSLWTEEALNSRRTRFTITAKDNQGHWHWMSYVFVRSKIKER